MNRASFTGWDMATWGNERTVVSLIDLGATITFTLIVETNAEALSRAINELARTTAHSASEVRRIVEALRRAIDEPTARNRRERQWEELKRDLAKVFAPLGGIPDLTRVLRGLDARSLERRRLRLAWDERRYRDLKPGNMVLHGAGAPRGGRTQLRSRQSYARVRCDRRRAVLRQERSRGR